MQTKLRVHLKKSVDDSYTIFIGMDIADIAGHIQSLNLGNSYFVITDSNVNKFFGKKLTQQLVKTGLKTTLISFPAGEASKTRQIKNALEDKLLELKAGRDSVIIALGGGVVGDMAGFLAATLHRGIPYVQIPTTLLAQVDSSIGGKVAVDHPKGKNLIGAFYQPKAVYIDSKVLSTLPVHEFYCGMAEVIKYGAILDTKFFEYLHKNSDTILSHDEATLNTIIKRCCELKRMVVEKDEKENDLRRILNFGHTVGHAIELLMNYKLSHGEAIAIGMMVETKISVSMGLIEPDSLPCMEFLLSMYHLPTTLPPQVQLQKLFTTTLLDKKAKAGAVHYTLLEEIGKAKVGIPLTPKEALTLYKQ